MDFKYQRDIFSKRYKENEKKDYNAKREPAARHRRAPAAPEELKYKDTGINFLMDSTPELPSPGTSYLNLVQRGDGPEQRTGRNIMMKSLHVSFICKYTIAGTSLGSTVATIYIIMDTQPNIGAAPVYADVFKSLSTGFTDCLPISLVNLQKQPRFRILKKFTFELNVFLEFAAVRNGTIHKYFSYYQKMNTPMSYNDGTGADAPCQNRIFMMAACSEALNDDVMEVYGNARLRFTDNTI